MNEPVQYVTTSDGYNIAYTVAGSGPPWLTVPPGFHDLHLMFEEDSVRPWLAGLAERFTLVRYDGRGQGLSTRGLRTTHTLTDHHLDILAILERLKLAPVILHGIGSSAHVAVSFAARHPDLVRALVLVHCSLTSAPWPPALMGTLASEDWQIFLTTMTRPERSLDAARAAHERLGQMVTREDFAIRFASYRDSDLEPDLLRLEIPTLVLHLRGVDRPSLSDSAALAARIRNATLAEVEPSAPPFFWGDYESAIGLIENWLAQHDERPSAERDAQIARPAAAAEGLSAREVEVLRLLVAGRSNQQIADDLVISLNTVRRHVSNIFAKTGAANRAQATAYAKDHGIA
jgi:DNA-binding CsgD family transcriptional regulator/pimeloyl-ACP methyl ester carboxylesterase